ncbi:MAG TPA: hypothetical protein DCF63_11525 [Planctomycetaceae bacterium]|nr:hypothetical protein [Planctomycetaceae bacterium]
MATAKFDPSEDRFIRGIIKRKVNQLIGRAGFTEQDREALEQDLFARVLQSLVHYDSKIGHRNKFVTAVVERYVANVLRDKQALKRDHQRVSSLNIVIEVCDEGPVELSHIIGEHEQDARLGRRRRSSQEQIDLAADIEALMPSLPEPWQKLLTLCKTMSVKEAAEQMGIARTTAASWLQRIGKGFEEAGMREYLDL